MMTGTEKDRDGISLDRAGGLVTITLSRLRTKNALTVEMWKRLSATLATLEQDPLVWAMVIQGEGDQFTSGSDVRQFGALNLEEAENAFFRMEEALSLLEQLPFPVVAAMDGFALGAGMQLALACDIRVATSRAQLGMPIGRFGILTSGDFARRMVELIGPGHTRDLLYTGRIISARTALRFGLVDRVVRADKLDRAIAELVGQLKDQSPSSLCSAKAAVAAVLQGKLPPTRFVHEIDFPEGVTAFLEGRRPRFTSR